MTQSFENITDRVFRERTFLHGARFAAHVHQDYWKLAAAGYFGDARIVSQRGDVIQDFGTGVCGSLCDFRLAGVHRNWDLDFPSELFQHRENSVEFYVGGNSFGTGPGGFASD